MLAELARHGDDDYFGGRTTLVVQPIAREAALAADYRQWRELATDWGGVWGGWNPPQ